MQDAQVGRVAAGADGCGYAIVFESKPFSTDDLESIVNQATRARVPFIGVVSTSGKSTALPIDMLLRALNAPIHFFPARMFDRLLETLWDGEHGNILVLGRGRDPRADLLEYLESEGRRKHAKTPEGRAVP
jgi:hypothetical protein